MGQVLSDNVWIGRSLLTKGSLRENIDPDLVGLVGSHLWADETAQPNVDPSSGKALTGLVDNVWVAGKLYAKGSTDIPADVIPKIGDHMWVDGPPSAAQDGQQEDASSGASDDSDGEDEVLGDDREASDPAESAAVDGSRPIVGTPPNKGGKGSSAALWLKYAEDNGVEVHAEAERHEIFDALKAAGVPTE